MEGATGVTCVDDCAAGTWQFTRFQPIFTGDVNAVAAGFFDAGVDEVVVTESHGSMRNLLLEQLDPRVQMISGWHKQYAMLAGIEERPHLVAFVGYHSAAGTPGVLSHTFIGPELLKVWLNGRVMSEGYLNAMLCAEFGARLALVSGDDLTCRDAREYAPDAQHVAVKTALDRHTARCLSPEVTALLLRDAAAKAVTTASVPALPPPPFTCELQFATANNASQAALIPGVARTGDNSIAFTFDTIDELYRCFTVATRLARYATERIYG
jgi:D-amino peptidase